MLPDLQDLLGKLRRDGPRQFARWKPAFFESVVAGPAHVLGERLEGESDTLAVLRGYLQMLQQATGLAALQQQPSPAGPWTSFLERCLVEKVPALLPGVKAGERLPLLVKVWNLGEGLLREPAWLDRYVAARAGQLTDLLYLETFLVETLGPVLSPLPRASWKGPFRVTVLDLRPLHEDFLPGEVALAAPSVLRIEDRRRKGLQAGVLLGHDGQSELLGLTDGLGDYEEPKDGPPVVFDDGSAAIGGLTVKVPLLRRCHQHAVVRAGFVAASADDSQRLWIVESP